MITEEIPFTKSTTFGGKGYFAAVGKSRIGLQIGISVLMYNYCLY